jgi:hypothetical protein
MKLSIINENLIELAIKNKLGSKYFGRPGLHSSPLYNPSSGHDSGSRVTGSSFLTGGVPKDPRHRKLLGFAPKKFSITL